MGTSARTKVADQVWIAVALLQRENPEAEGFTASQIKDRVRQEFGSVAPGIETHIRQHCLADKEPRPGRYRMLTKVGRDKYRLFREGDPCHPDRENAKMSPSRADVEAQYPGLMDWYEEEWAPHIKIFGPEALAQWLSIKPGHSGHTDISANKHKYLTEAYFEHLRRASGP